MRSGSARGSGPYLFSPGDPRRSKKTRRMTGPATGSRIQKKLKALKSESCRRRAAAATPGQRASAVHATPITELAFVVMRQGDQEVEEYVEEEEHPVFGPGGAAFFDGIFPPAFKPVFHVSSFRCLPSRGVGPGGIRWTRSLGLDGPGRGIRQNRTNRSPPPSLTPRSGRRPAPPSRRRG